MSDYFMSNANKAVDKRASKILIKKIHNELSDVLSGIGCLKEPLHCR